MVSNRMFHALHNFLLFAGSSGQALFQEHKLCKVYETTDIVDTGCARVRISIPYNFLQLVYLWCID